MRPAQLFVAASASYAVNVALGTAVAVRLIDTTGYRWLHHALYVLTVALTAAALTTAITSSTTHRKAVVLAPVVLPLAVMPAASPSSRWHAVTALAAAPFFAAGVLARES